MVDKTNKKAKINAIFNLVAGGFGLLAAFNVITGGTDIDILLLLLAIIFLSAGVWGLLPINRS